MHVACSQAWLPQRMGEASASQPEQVQISGAGDNAAAHPPVAEDVHSQNAGTDSASAAAGVPDEQAGASAATGSAVPACKPVCKPADTVLPGWAQCRPSGEDDTLAGSRAAELPRLPADLQLRLAAEDTPAPQRLPPVAHLGDDTAPIHSRTRAHFNLQHVTLDDLEKALPPLPPEQPWQPELAPQQQDDIFYQSFLQVRRPKLCPAPCLLAVQILCACWENPACGLPASTDITLRCLLATSGCIRLLAEHLVLDS